MNAWLQRLRQLPADVRSSQLRAAAWAVAAALLDGACGVLIVPLVRAWFGGEARATLSWVAVLGALTICQAVVLYLAQRKGYRAGGRLAAGLTAQLVRHLPRVADWARVRDSHPAGLLQGPVMRAMSIPAHLLGPSIGAVVTPLAAIAGLALIDPVLAGMLALATLLLCLLFNWSGARTIALEQARTASGQTMAEQLQIFAAHQQILRFAGRDSAARAVFQHALDGQHRATLALMRRSLPVELVFAGSVQLIFVALLCGGAWAVTAGRLDAATTIATLVLLVRFIEPLSQLTQIGQALGEAGRALDSVHAVRQAPRLESPASGPAPRDASVEATQLAYRTEGGASLLSGIDLCCRTGELLAIVGPTGAGKSTLLDLLARVVDPTAGRVLFGGVDVRALDEASLAAARNLVFQDNALFRGSVASNLRIGNPGASRAELVAALREVGLEREIEALPQGLDTELGPGGQTLSGGQRQRLCFARGLVSAAPVLLLDEPTANLDELNTRRVRDSLVAMRGRRSCIVVTHSPMLAREADWIVVLEAGRVRAQGSHARLDAADAWYRAFARDEVAGGSERESGAGRRSGGAPLPGIDRETPKTEK